jgi:uncharacterized protein YjbJ (UPF0337 family)
MINQQLLDDNWHEVCDKLRAKWGDLSEDDLRTFNGNVEQLVGRIQYKTGETREAIERFLERLADEGSGVFSGIRDKIEETTDQAVAGARVGYEALRQRYTEAERVVQQRPGQAVGIAFGLGILSGLGVALLLHDWRRGSTISRSRSAAEHLGRQMLDALAGIMPDSRARKPRG